MDGTTTIPLGEVKFCHEDRLQAVLICTKALLQQLPGVFGVLEVAKNGFGKSEMRKEISIKAEVLRTSSASIALVSLAIGLALSAGVGALTP